METEMITASYYKQKTKATRAEMTQADCDVKFPHVHVKLSGEDGNAFAILGRVTRAMRQAGISPAEIKAFQTAATSGNYDHLLQMVMRYVSQARHAGR
jgi:hypothetical protein